MNNNIYFSLSGMFFITLLVIVFFFKKRLETLENKIYKLLIIFALTGGILELSQIGTCFFMNTDFSWINSLVSRLYLVNILSWISLLSVYTIVVSFDKKHYRALSYIVIGICAICSICFLVLPIKYYFESGHLIYSYTYGPSVDLLKVTSIIFLIFSIFCLMLHIKQLKSKKFLPIIIYVIFFLVAAIIQIINPSMIFTQFVQIFTTFLMYFTIENPDLKMIEQLENARNQADKANKAKTDFLSSMSHEIRTPLNAIVGFSDYIITSESLDEAKENAKDIINASNTLLEIVNSILDISKIEAGKLEIINSQYDAKNTFESLAKLITPKMKEKGLDFTYYIAPDIPDTLYGDPANIKKIVTNILSNAYKYTDKGFVRYEVNCINNPPLTKLIISVEDSGRGIKQEKIDKLFTKFQRLDEDRNTTIEGTGLGLAITKQLTELMGGKILVHTKYGEGSKFTIILSQKIENTKEKEKKQELKTTLDLTDKKILIVDDNELNLKVASKVLQRYNANNIETLDNGFACIEKIKSNEKYDVILLDDMMPKMGGIETLKKLKEIPNFKIPVVALTANAISGMKEKYLNEGFDAYLAKPIEKDELIKVMNQLLFKEDALEKTEILEIIDEETIEEYEEKKQKNLSKKKITENIINSLKEQTPVVEVNELYLQENGVNLDLSLEILGDMEIYNETIKDFVNIVKTKFERIKVYKNENDLENYAIEVHSLKSDAQHLGFVDLAELAYQHEIKSKAQDKKFIDKYFSTLEDEYLRVLEVAKKYTASLK